jgi:heme/copper-type cytochrome/quinol oxidase subunit 4
MEQVGGVLKAVSLPLVSVTELLSKPKKQAGGAEVKNTLYDNWISFVASIMFMVLAGYLAWMCNVKEDAVLRTIYTILAVIFNGFYLIYYFIYRVLMGYKCVVSATVS